MSYLQKLCTLALILTFSGAAVAQETTTGTTTTPTTQSGTETASDTETAPETDPEAPAVATEIERSMGVDVNAENGIGTVYVKETYGDWELQCFRVPEGETEPCQLYQLLKDENGNGVAEVNFISLPGDQQAAAGATIVTPLETLLTQQLTLAIDGGPTKRYPFTWCGAGGCYSRIGFSNADVAAFKRGANAKITVVPVAAPDQKVVVTMSLTGFTDGYNAVLAANK
ncbi:MAG: invasion associated locus B family protein [Marinosulfonomonas sp.]|nr:invasion associated locus B family protein [Marinosulfonomonas sp.]